MFFRLLRGYYEKGVPIIDKKKIVKNYLKTLFITDIISFIAMLFDITIIFFVKYKTYISVLFFFKAWNLNKYNTKIIRIL